LPTLYFVDVGNRREVGLCENTAPVSVCLSVCLWIWMLFLVCPSFFLIHIVSDLACTHARSEALNGVEVRSWKLEDNRGVIVRCSIRDGARSPVFSFVAVFLPMRYRPCLRVSLNLFLVLSSARRTDRTRFVSQLFTRSLFCLSFALFCCHFNVPGDSTEVHVGTVLAGWSMDVV
jgi:hypothetical protein